MRFLPIIFKDGIRNGLLWFTDISQTTRFTVCQVLLVKFNALHPTCFFHTIFNARISIICFIVYCGPQVNLNKIASDLLNEEAKIP